MRGAEEDDLEASMRPLPYGSGKAGINAPARCYTRRASMRPLPYGSGKRHQSLQAPHRRRLGFNEAAPLRKRKGALGQPQGVRRPPGFNEAAPLRKRKVRNALTRSVETSASMRPLPYGSGKPCSRVGHEQRGWASMRPLPYGSGKMPWSRSTSNNSQLQ